MNDRCAAVPTERRPVVPATRTASESPLVSSATEIDAGSIQTATSLLIYLAKLDVEVDEEAGELRINDPRKRLAGELEETLARMSDRVLAHLSGSPGRQILDYPVKHKTFPIEFQELLIEAQRKLGKILEAKESGASRDRWLDLEPTQERLAEIATELGIE